MEVSLYQAAAAMNATAQWQEMVAENLTAAPISGGRKHEISFADVQAGMNPSSSGAQVSNFIPTAHIATDFEQGELHASSNPMDFALEGPGFFTVKLPNGQKAFTRGGEFELNAKGQLVTTRGYPVLGNGAPLQFNPNSTDPVTISASGDVSQGQHHVGKLDLVEFDHPEFLTTLGADSFRSDNPLAKMTTATNTRVRQGFLEAANSSPTTEMSGMVTAMRMFEANQKVMQMQSDRMNRTITELGGTS
ncbi:MAG TPA: flagellar hook-basal body protein [Pseudomonadales bacterium]|nr:flagellar hook-basal body protein [Pseudomonadales bacterium]